MWKFCGNSAETVAFPQNFHARKLDEIAVFYAANNGCKMLIVDASSVCYYGGAVVQWFSLLHNFILQPELRFCAGSTPARGVSEISDSEDL